MSDLHYFNPDWITPSSDRLAVDVCIYGGTSAGIIAAVEAKQAGKSVVVLQPGKFIGGLTSGGLGWTDFGQKKVIGGRSRDFYLRVGTHYGVDEEFQFEPHVASAVFDELVRESALDVRRCQYLDKVENWGGCIVSITMLGGLQVAAKMFIDATYEGDLLALAGVSFTVGREANAQYGETIDGIQVHEQHQFDLPVDPYVREGDPSSGLLPQVENVDLAGKQGEGDRRIQAYNFRVCMTDDPALKVDWQKPDGFDASQYELAARWFATADKGKYNELLDKNGSLNKFDVLPHRTPGGFRKTDTNNHGPVSSDFIGANWKWPEPDYAAREKIFQRHVAYQQGYYWFVANDTRVPERYRIAMAKWGLPRDEFTTSGHWPAQLYVREARRMVADVVVTEHVCRGEQTAEDSVGIGSYNMDSHNCTRFVRLIDGKPSVWNDGDVQKPTVPYPISYKAIVPKRGECTNLLVPVCLSASHIAYGSIRMEPVFMALAQSAAAAACMAIDRHCAVQDVPYDLLQKKLLDEKQMLKPD